MTLIDYASHDGLSLASLVKQGEISPEELLDTAIEQVEILNPKLNAIVTKMYDEAKQTIKDGLPQGPFEGVPFLLKDLLVDYAGVPLTSGSRFTQQYIPSQTSELVNRINQSGLVIFGKTNVPEFGLSSVTEPQAFGPTLNPWDLTRNAGGSSGGSAAAVASGMVPIAHGNDGGGSIRIPASYCGLFGFKPSRGRTAGGSDMMRMWENMVVEHALTRSVRDSAAMLDVLAGPEIGSSIALPKPEISFLQSLGKSPGKLKIGLIDKPLFHTHLELECVEATHKAARLCEELGHHVEEVTLDLNTDEISLAYIIIIAGEISASIKRLSDKMQRKLNLLELEKQTVLLYHIGDHISASDFAWAANVMDKTARLMGQYFLDVDVLLTPTMPSTAPKLGQLKPNFFEQRGIDLLTHLPFTPLLLKALEHAASKQFSFHPYTPIFNISGQPAMSVPLYWDAQGLPIGIQFAGRYGQEEVLFQLAGQLEKALPWIHKKPVM